MGPACLWLCCQLRKSARIGLTEAVCDRSTLSMRKRQRFQLGSMPSLRRKKRSRARAPSVNRALGHGTRRCRQAGNCQCRARRSVYAKLQRHVRVRVFDRTSWMSCTYIYVMHVHMYCLAGNASCSMLPKSGPYEPRRFRPSCLVARAGRVRMHSFRNDVDTRGAGMKSCGESFECSYRYSCH